MSQDNNRMVAQDEVDNNAEKEKKFLPFCATIKWCNVMVYYFLIKKNKQ